MHDDSIAGRTQTLRQDMEVLLQEKRKVRLVAIREELRLLVEKANRHWGADRLV